MQRWIIHIDMDAFFAAVEQRDHPELLGLPVIIGGLGGRGVVSTASYEARRFGVHSAMPMTEARRRCPQGIFLAGDHLKYAQVSSQIMRILSNFSPLIEPLSLDEAFLDVSGMEWLCSDPAAIALQIKEQIKKELQLTASAGVAPNKFLAKMASEMRKPDGLMVIHPGEEAAVLADMPIRSLWGVGETMAASLRKLGIATIGQLAKTAPGSLERHIGKSAYELCALASGHDERVVVTEHIAKSLGKEITFAIDLTSRTAVCEQLLILAEKVGWRLRRAGLAGRTLTVKLRFASFRTLTRSQTFSEVISTDEALYSAARSICDRVTLNEGVRLLGISMTHLEVGSSQTSLFPDVVETKRRLVCETVDKLKNKYGEGIVARGRITNDKE